MCREAAIGFVQFSAWPITANGQERPLVLTQLVINTRRADRTIDFVLSWQTVISKPGN